jgi:quercetin dioxygenase-like cupin family protein
MHKLPELHEFEKMPFEKLNNKVSRRYIYGEKVMLVYFDLKKGAIIPEHHHVSEQVTYIVKGKVKVLSGGKEFIVSKGEVLLIPSNTPHRFEALEDTIDIDVFSPPRQDWIEGTDNYLKS